MKMALKIALYTFLLGFLTLTGMAQKGVEDGSRYGHGEDSIRCIKNLSLYREYIKHGDYDMGIGPWRIVFEECPKSTKNIYIDGAKMFNDLVDNQKDPGKKSIVNGLPAHYLRPADQVLQATRYSPRQKGRGYPQAPGIQDRSGYPGRGIRVSQGIHLTP